MQSTPTAGLNLEQIWSDLFFQPGIRERLFDSLEKFNRGAPASRGLMVYGPPGTGKSEILRHISRSVACPTMSLGVTQLKAAYIGQSGALVKQAWAKARAAGRCVMLIDECDWVFMRRGGRHSDSSSAELVNEFLSEWDTGGAFVWVVVAADRRYLVDEAIDSRLGASIATVLPATRERLQILHRQFELLGRSQPIPDFVGPATYGWSGRDMAGLARDVYRLGTQRGAEVSDATLHDVLQEKSQRPRRGVNDSPRWESLALGDSTLQELQVLCDKVRQMRDAKFNGITLPMRVLLFGPSSEDNAAAALTFANESTLPFFTLRRADFADNRGGETAARLREFLGSPRATGPRILFIDELDRCCPRRGSAYSDAATQDFTEQMLQAMSAAEIEAAEVFVLAATAAPQAIDESVRLRMTLSVNIEQVRP